MRFMRASVGAGMGRRQQRTRTTIGADTPVVAERPSIQEARCLRRCYHPYVWEPYSCGPLVCFQIPNYAFPPFAVH